MCVPSSVLNGSSFLHFYTHKINSIACKVIKDLQNRIKASCQVIKYGNYEWKIPSVIISRPSFIIDCLEVFRKAVQSPLQPHFPFILPGTPPELAQLKLAVGVCLPVFPRT